MVHRNSKNNKHPNKVHPSAKKIKTMKSRLPNIVHPCAKESAVVLKMTLHTVLLCHQRAPKDKKAAYQTMRSQRGS